MSPDYVEIELPNSEPLSATQSSTASTILSLTKKSGMAIAQGTKTVIVAEGTSFICSNALYSLLMTIFAGYPSIAPSVAKELAKYQIPAVAIPVVIIASLHELKVNGSELPARLVTSVTNGLGMATFSIPIAMQLITRIVQIIKDESRDTPVWISNGLADTVIAGCGLVGICQAIQIYFHKINADSPDQERSLLNKFTTNKFMIVVFAMMNSASAFHAATFQLMKLLELDTTSLVNYYTRMGVTFTAGLVGGVCLGRANPQTRMDAKIFNALASLAKLAALGIAFTDTFYRSPSAELVFGEEVIDEQTWLWSVIIPSIPMIILLLQFAGLQGPKLWKALSEIVTNIVTCCERDNKESDVIPLQDNYSVNSDILVKYSAIANSNPVLEESIDEKELNKSNVL